MHHVGTIKSISRYPVKSMADEQLSSAELGWHGIDGDRRFAFVRADNLSGVPWLTASKLPELILYKAYHAGESDARSQSVRVRTPQGVDVEVENESLRHQLIAAFGADLTLIRVNNGIFDESPVSLISATTIHRLEMKLGCTLDPRRFRSNFLIEGVDNNPLLEDAWIGKTLVLGDHADSPAIRITIRDVRCVIVNFDPETAAAEPRLLQTIARTQENCAGVYASVIRTGTVSAGVGVYLVDVSPTMDRT